MPPAETDQEHRARLIEQNAALKRGLEIKDTKPEAAISVEWLEKENEMLQHQANLLAKSKRLLETEAGKLEALFQLQFLNSVPLPVWTADLEAKIVCWAGAAERAYGFRAEWALGKNFVDLFVAEAEKKQALSDVSSIIYGQEGLEHFNLCKDKDRNGKQVYLVTCCFPLYDPRSNQITQAEISFDLSRLPALEQELEDMYHKHRMEVDVESRRRLAIVETLTRELFAEVKQYYNRERKSIEERIEKNHDKLSNPASTQAETRRHSESLNENTQLLRDLDQWEVDMKDQIARAETPSALDNVRVVIRGRTQRYV